jgi:hypothetical protein
MLARSSAGVDAARWRDPALRGQHEELDLEIGADVWFEMNASTWRSLSRSIASMNFCCIAY